ncbi:hypothetical protein PHMEG_00029252 [Phytophthora megakarya]|uniref:Uncharacterized protein n=1 Tax=Phytophthora megakarya TaxID=4795 RepID=A0A225V405_9STRA|nr:hypothetical protein PHMEG_00029252 [Phytophthora megakarya]
MAKKRRAITWSLPYEVYPVLLIPERIVAKYGRKTVSYLVKGFATKPLQNNSNDCGVFVLYFMRQVNTTLVKSGGDILLLQRLGEICAKPKHVRGRFNPDFVRMNFVKLLRNDEILFV